MEELDTLVRHCRTNSFGVGRLLCWEMVLATDAVPRLSRLKEPRPSMFSGLATGGSGPGWMGTALALYMKK